MADSKAQPSSNEGSPKFAISLTLPKDQTGDKTANQVRAHLQDIFCTYGVVDEIKVISGDTAFSTTIIFTRLLQKGQNLQLSIDKDEKPKVSVYDTPTDVVLAADARGSGGGRASKTASKPSKNSGGARGRGGRGGGPGRGGGAPRGGAAQRGGAATRGARGGKGAADKGGKKGDEKKGDEKKGDEKKEEKKGGEKKDAKKKT